MKPRLALLALGIIAAPRMAVAHTVAGVESGTDTWIVVALAVTLVLYGVGIARLWRCAGIGRGIPGAKVVLFAAGWTVIVLALVSPLAAASSVSFAAHMVEHELLMAVAAPILVLSRPLGAIVWALPSATRRVLGRITRSTGFSTVWNAILRPGPAWALHAAVLWSWHAPVLFQSALESDAAHAAQHASFLAAGLLYWWSLLRPAERGHRGIAILSLFATSMHSTLLGALLAISGTVWYPGYRVGPGAFGLSPLEDQQLAGLIMWVPSGLIYVAAALALLYGLLKAAPRESLTGGVHVART